MSKLLDQAVAAVRDLPPDRQDEIARAMLALAGDDAEPEPIDPAHLAAVLEGLAQAKRGERATPQQVEAVFRRFGE
jgi:predicted transcriptional regulator